LSDQIEKNEMGGGWHEANIGERRCVYGVLVGKPEGKRLLGRPRRGCEDDIKMDLQEVRCVAWTGLIWLRIGTGGKFVSESSGSIKCREFLDHLRTG
jgi:hypothetical protein